MTSPLANRTITLAVTGSIAAFKSVLVARLLVQSGARVIPVLTHSASRFVGGVTFAAVTGHVAHQAMWDPSAARELHVEIAAESDLILVAPATADVIARFVSGRADDLVTAIVLCAKGPVLAAPAMHPRMWAHPATQANVVELARQGRVTTVGPVYGVVATGEEGVGRMSEPEDIVRAAEAMLSPRDLTGVRLVVTAGPTQEGVDPVRYLTNRSSGTMGFRVAERAAARGATVTLIAGPVSKPTPHGVTRVDVTDALSMSEALATAMKTNLCGADALVMAAAVSDYRPASLSAQKLKRGDGSKTLELIPNPDLLASVGASRRGARPLLIGFALETADGADLVALAREKLSRKKVDIVVANPASVALGGETSRAFLVTRESAEEVGPADKRVIADRILDAVRDRLADKGGTAA